MEEFLNNSQVENIVGISGTFFVTLALVPQVYKTFKTHSSKDLSFKWLIIEGIGSGFMIAYGILKNDLLIIIINSVISISHILLIIAKCKYEKCQKIKNCNNKLKFSTIFVSKV